MFAALSLIEFIWMSETFMALNLSGAPSPVNAKERERRDAGLAFVAELLWFPRKPRVAQGAMIAANELFSVKGRTALVTGGATGLGRICAEALLSAGARVLIASRKAEACEAVAQELSPLGQCEGFGGTVANEAGVAALAAETRKRTDTLHILVNNAGANWGGPFETFPWKAWDRVLSVNVTGLFTLTRDLGPDADRFGDARLAFDRDQHGFGHGHRDAVGNRMGLFRLEGRGASPDPHPRGGTRREAGDRERVRARTVSDQHDQVRHRDEAGQARSAKSVPMGRVGRPEDIAGPLLFLAGRGGAYTTGAILPVDGGVGVTAPPAMFGDLE